LVFEENGSFPANRSELYETGLDVLLKKWDVKRNIQRDEVYKKLSLKRKEDLLSQIAKTTFEAGNYFFKQKEVERQITAYIENLPDANTDSEALQLDSEAVLKSIEAQHGLFVERAKKIYSFSHLTFHEYFAARKIATSCNQYAADDPTLQALVNHITEKRWREVIVLTVGMLQSADGLLQMMKRQIDGLLAEDKRLQEFLAWVKQKAESVEAPYKPAAVRAFYLALDPDLGRALAFDVAPDFARLFNLGRALDHALDLGRALAFDVALDHTLDLGRALTFDVALDRALVLNLDHALNLAFYDVALDCGGLDRELQHKLQQLKEQLPDTSYENRENCEQWRQAKGQTWTEQLRAVMIEHRNIGHDWQFTYFQQELLQQYYAANKLLVDCLKSECCVSRAVREEIEATFAAAKRES
jgi:predicted NACHT family NTPase